MAAMLAETLRSANNVSDSAIRDAYEEPNARHVQAMEDMRAIVRGARKGRLPPVHIMRVLRLANVSQANAAALLRDGEIAPLSLSDASLRVAINRAALLDSGIKPAELRRRFALATEEERRERKEMARRAAPRTRSREVPGSEG